MDGSRRLGQPLQRRRPAPARKRGNRMRIIGGRLRGQALAGPGTATGLRPTADRVRESLFNLLAHGPYGDPPPPEAPETSTVSSSVCRLAMRSCMAWACCMN